MSAGYDPEATGLRQLIAPPAGRRRRRNVAGTIGRVGLILLFLPCVSILAIGCGERRGTRPAEFSYLGARPLSYHPKGPPSNPRNLLLVSLDTLRADHVSAYGYAKPTSPKLDRLASQGVLFERAFSQSPHTAQSHMSVFTSLYPSEHGVHNYQDGVPTRLDESVPTLAGILRAAGYRTRAIVSGGNISGRLGFDQGFDRYEEVGSAARPAFSRAIDALHALSEGDSAARAPFFLFVHTYEIHDPYVSDPRYQPYLCDSSYSGSVIDTREELARRTRGSGYQESHRTYWDAVDATREEDIRRLRCLYDVGIRAADHHLGRLLDEVESLGLERDTAIVVFSDHGEEFMEHGRFAHEQLYQELLHVPLVLRMPGAGATPGSRISTRVRLIDLLPTLTDYLGLPHPTHAQGESLLPLLRGEEETDRVVFAEFRRRGASSLHVGSWKIIARTPHVGRRRIELGDWSFQIERRRNRSELFDLSRDRDELEDVAERHPERLQQMQTLVDRATSQLRAVNSALENSVVGVDAETMRELEALGYVAP